MPLYLVLYVAVIFRHTFLHVFAWRRIEVRIFDPKPLWCYYSKCYSNIIENAINLLCVCFIVIHSKSIRDAMVFTFWPVRTKVNPISCRSQKTPAETEKVHFQLWILLYFWWGEQKKLELRKFSFLFFFLFCRVFWQSGVQT